MKIKENRKAEIGKGAGEFGEESQELRRVGDGEAEEGPAAIGVSKAEFLMLMAWENWIGVGLRGPTRNGRNGIGVCEEHEVSHGLRHNG